MTEENTEQRPEGAPEMEIDNVKQEEGTGEQQMTQTQVDAMVGFLKSMRPGQDMTRSAVPASLVCPMTQLELVRKSTLLHMSLLQEATRQQDAIDRMVAVVKYYISYFKPPDKKVAQGKPLNPVQSETCRAQMGGLTYVGEQVSHHPPISAAHCTDPESGFTITQQYENKVTFAWTHLKIVWKGKTDIYFKEHDEHYTWRMPNLCIRVFRLFAEFTDTVTIQCKESGLSADIEFLPKPVGSGKVNGIRGKIYFTENKNKPIFTLDGHWDRVVMIAGPAGTKGSEPKEFLNRANLAVDEWQEFLEDSHAHLESANVWGNVKSAADKRDMQAMQTAKTQVEEMQRKLRTLGAIPAPRHFRFVEETNTWEPTGIPITE